MVLFIEGRHRNGATFMLGTMRLQNARRSHSIQAAQDRHSENTCPAIAAPGSRDRIVPCSGDRAARQLCSHLDKIIIRLAKTVGDRNLKVRSGCESDELMRLCEYAKNVRRGADEPIFQPVNQKILPAEPIFTVRSASREL
jgi:hypothetical protein